MAEAASAPPGKSAETCPRCGSGVPHLVPVDAGLKLRLQESGEDSNVPDQVCIKCFNELRKVSSHGAKLRAQAKQREEQRMRLWNARVGLIKSAREQMKNKGYSDAAVTYEKYIKSLEIVFDAKPGMLSPDNFKQKAHQKELTVITSVYWDLVCIYDTSPRYGSRMHKAADKLAEFARFTPIYPSIIKKAQSFQRKCNNPRVIKRFLKNADSSRPTCFIATAAFPERPSMEVATLVAFREQVLKNSSAGSTLIDLYYYFSPNIAQAIERYPTLLRPLIRPWIRGIALVVNKIFKLQRM